MKIGHFEWSLWIDWEEKVKDNSRPVFDQNILKIFPFQFPFPSLLAIDHSKYQAHSHLPQLMLTEKSISEKRFILLQKNDCNKVSKPFGLQQQHDHHAMSLIFVFYV
jgi:hypothetical protein